MPASSSPVGPLLVALGLVLVVVGLVAGAGGLSWFGRLPGDVRIERGSVRLYAPIASMLVVSLLFSAAAALARRFFR
jgi:membrane protein implicated in regulation of membrane protease activity